MNIRRSFLRIVVVSAISVVAAGSPFYISNLLNRQKIKISVRIKRKSSDDDDFVFKSFDSKSKYLNYLRHILENDNVKFYYGRDQLTQQWVYQFEDIEQYFEWSAKIKHEFQLAKRPQSTLTEFKSRASASPFAYHEEVELTDT